MERPEPHSRFVTLPGPAARDPDQLVNLRTCRCGGICRRCAPEIQRRLAILHGDAATEMRTMRQRKLMAYILAAARPTN